MTIPTPVKRPVRQGSRGVAHWKNPPLIPLLCSTGFAPVMSIRVRRRQCRTSERTAERFPTGARSTRSSAYKLSRRSHHRSKANVGPDPQQDSPAGWCTCLLLPHDSRRSTRYRITTRSQRPFYFLPWPCPILFPPMTLALALIPFLTPTLALLMMPPLLCLLP